MKPCSSHRLPAASVFLFATSLFVFASCSPEKTSTGGGDAGGPDKAADPGVGRFVGTWVIDHDLTLKEVMKSPEYTEDRAAEVKADVKMMADSTVLKVGDGSLTISVQTEKGVPDETYPFTVTTASGNSVTVGVKQGDDESTLVFKEVNGGRMRLEWSVGEDLDDFIWKKK